jgi:hypothetical protein
MTHHPISDDSMQPKNLTTEPRFEERRNAMRFPRDPGMDFAEILEPQNLAGTVEVADESLGGLAIVVPVGQPFEQNVQLRLRYAGSCYLASVRHVTQRIDGQWNVGLLCEPTGD